MLRIKIIIPFIIIIFLTSGCITLKSSNQQAGAIDGGIFKSINKGDIWSQAVLIPTTSGKPNSIATLSVNSLVMDPSDHRAIYYGSVGNGLYYTYDGARNWFPTPGLGKGTIKDIAIDPESKCIIYAAIGNKLLKSTDCNRTWSQMYYDSDLRVSVNNIAVDHYNSEVVYIGTSRGEIIKSYDRGVSWTTLYRMQDPILRIVIAPDDSRSMFVGTKNKGVFRSSDNGVSWTNLSDNLKEFKAGKKFKDLAFSQAQPGLIYLATGYGLLKSEDRGDNWQAIELIPPSQKATINAIAVSPQEPKEIYYVTNTTFYRSLDGGENWTIKKLPTSKAGWKLLINPKDPKVIYLGVRSLK